MLRIASRPSTLALAQASLVKERLQAQLCGLAVEIVPIRSSGDKLANASLARIGGKGLFIRELEQALLDRRANLAVHSMKDLPAVLAPQFRIIAVPEREDPHDVLITRKAGGFSSLPAGAKLGTSSLRRRLQARRARADLNVVGLRGNIDTRLRRLEDGDFDAVILAMAGLKRLGLERRLNLEELDEDDFVPAGGQGALAIEALAESPLCASAELEKAALSLNDRAAAAEVTAERAFLEAIAASCVSPVGVRANLADGMLRLHALLLNSSGSRTLDDQIAIECDINDAGLPETARKLGVALGQRLLDLGASELIHSE
jgi:hydroxymethylbilane synthase